MAYNTGNPVGSIDPRDLLDNVQNLDKAVNGEGYWTDRTGDEHPTFPRLAADYPMAGVFSEQAEASAAQAATDKDATAILASQAETAAGRAEGASEVAMAAGWVYTSSAAGEAARSNGEYFWVESASIDEVLELWIMGVSAATDTGKRQPSVQSVTSKSRVSAYQFGQPNLFSYEQTDLDPAAYSGSAAAEFGIDFVNGRKVLSIADGSLIAEFPASAFSDSGLISASVWVEALVGANALSRLRVLQSNAAGAPLLYTESYFGTADFSEPRFHEVKGVALEPTCDNVRFILQTSDTTGSSAFVRDLTMVQGSDSSFRPPSIESIQESMVRLKLLLAETDMEIVSSSNLANPEYIVEGQYVNSGGTITTAEGWAMIRIPVQASGTYAFGNFQIASAGYSAFQDGAGGLLQYNGNFTNVSLPKTYTAPAVDCFLCITVARPSNTPDDRALLTVSEGEVVLPYEQPIDTITAISGKKIAGSVNPSEYARLGFDADFGAVVAGSITASALILNLPSGTSQPAGLDINQAWVDETDGTIKVRLT